jgi:hypothetical protein
MGQRRVLDLNCYPIPTPDPHIARARIVFPFGMTYYLGSVLSQLRGKRVVGYRKASGRMVVFDVADRQ